MLFFLIVLMKYRMEFRGMKGELYMAYTEDLKQFLGII